MIRSALLLLGDGAKTEEQQTDIEDDDIPELVKYDRLVGTKRKPGESIT